MEWLELLLMADRDRLIVWNRVGSTRKLTPMVSSIVPCLHYASSIVWGKIGLEQKA
jgi:hypothetical protein